MRFYLAILCMAMSTLQAIAQKQSFKITSKSQVTISGATNINKYSCNAKYRNINEKLTFNPSKVVVGKYDMTGKITLYAEDFSCGNFIMNKDFKNTLEADKHPTLTIRLIDLQRVSFLLRQTSPI